MPLTHHCANDLLQPCLTFSEIQSHKSTNQSLQSQIQTLGRRWRDPRVVFFSFKNIYHIRYCKLYRQLFQENIADRIITTKFVFTNQALSYFSIVSRLEPAIATNEKVVTANVHFKNHVGVQLLQRLTSTQCFCLLSLACLTNLLFLPRFNCSLNKLSIHLKISVFYDFLFSTGSGRIILNVIRNSGYAWKKKKKMRERDQ